MLATGGFAGTLENGATFTQVPIVNNQSYRLHKFSTQQVHFYVSDQGVFAAANDLAALSIYTYLAAA
jgi:hypothetical protein